MNKIVIIGFTVIVLSFTAGLASSGFNFAEAAGGWKPAVDALLAQITGLGERTSDLEDEVFCSGNGTYDSGTCTCDGGFTGDDCSETDSVCGNGTVDPGEQCDDGNNVNGDGCSSTCQFEACIPSDEVCDGIDNNCDGIADDGFSCVAGEITSCGSNIGECQSGTQTCSASCVLGSCVGGIAPSAEICDGLDNDCDTDVDEGCSCTLGETQPCGSDVGACQAGTQTCVGGEFGECVGAIGPSAEICDGLDNDCDADVDEGCP